MTEPIPDYLKSDFFRELYTDIHRFGLDATIMIFGRKRTGKSTLALKILELLNLMKEYEKYGGPENVPDDVFDQYVRERVFFRVGAYAQAIATAKTAGMVLILDEAGVDASNLRWWDTQVKSLRDIMHVDGIRHLILIIVLPKKMHFAKGARDMVNIEIKTKSVNKETRKTYCSIKHFGLIDDINKDYGVYQRSKEGCRVVGYLISPPHKKLIDAYQRIEGAAKEKIIEEKVGEIINAAKGKDTKEEVAIRDEEIIQKIVANPTRYVKFRLREGKIQIGLIESDFNVGGGVARRIKQKLEADHSNLLNRHT